jgi:phosphoribosylaminoimidazole-succinocarboxamide synthase
MIAPIDDVSVLDEYLPAEKRFAYPEYLSGRSMIVKKAKRIDVECVVRGYIAGSAWSEYQKQGTICGIELPDGLKQSQELPEPIFTPTTKADNGHDEPITVAEMKQMIGDQLTEDIIEKSLAIYNYGREYARKRGLIMADTKFEFGLDNDRLILIDELLTPDSSRLWEMELYEVGKDQPSYDKQPVRDWLSNSGWDKKPPAPMLPPDVIEATTLRYEQAYEKLTGNKLG